MPEILRKLTAKTADLRGVPGGGIPDLSVEEIAGALAGLPDGPHYLARAVWCGDESSIRALLLVTVEASRQFPARLVLYPGMLQDLAAFALAAVVVPNLCYRCAGRGNLYGRGGVVTTCDVCHGTGQGQPEPDNVRRQIKASKAQWRQIEPHYHRIELLIHDWLNTAGHHVRNQLA